LDERVQDGIAGFEQHNGGAGCIWLDRQDCFHEIAHRVGIVGIALGKTSIAPAHSH